MARHGPGSFVASLVVLAVAGGFAGYAADAVSGNVGAVRSYEARFSSSSGLAAGGAVTVAGITVGRIERIALDPEHFASMVRFSVDRSIVLHPDVSLSVGTAMGGGGSLAVAPGHASGALGHGTVITLAQPAQSLEQQVGDYIFGAGGLGSN